MPHLIGRSVALVVLTLGASLLAFSGCAGRSTGQHDGGGKSGTGGTITSGGGAGTAQGGTAASGGSGDTSGSGGSAGASPSLDDCFVDGKWVTNGSHWTEDCNTCWCRDSKRECTLLECGGAGGSAGTTGASGGRGGAGGEGGEPACEAPAFSAFCIQSLQLDQGGQSLGPGDPLILTLFPSGCRSSSCTKVVSAACSYLGSENQIWVSPFVCLRQEGDVCTDDCGGGVSSCDVGLMLAEGVTTVYLAGSDLSVTFEVPSTVDVGGYCAGEPFQ